MRPWIVWLVVVVAGAASPAATQEKTLHYWENDSIKTEVTDDEYPYDQISYRYGTPLWVSNLVELRLALWNGAEVWEYNITKQVNGFFILTEVEDWTFGGAGPHQFAHVVLGDHAAMPSFTVELTIHMEGNGTKALRSDIVIRGVTGGLSGAKRYLYGDPNVSGNLGSDRVAYDAGHGLIYVYDSATAPNLYFGLAHATGTPFAMHYRGHVWTTPWQILDNIRYGQNLPDSAPTGAGDQIAGWSWDLGTITAGGSVSLPYYMGVGTSLNDLTRARSGMPDKISQTRCASPAHHSRDDSSPTVSAVSVLARMRASSPRVGLPSVRTSRQLRESLHRGTRGWRAGAGASWGWVERRLAWPIPGPGQRHGAAWARGWAMGALPQALPDPAAP